MVVNENSKLPDVVLCFQCILRFLNLEGINDLQIKTFPKIYHKLPSDELDYLLFKTEAELVRSDVTSVIYNAHKLKIKSSNRKRGLKRAIKNDLVVKEVNEFEVFWESILKPNLKRKHNTIPTHSLEEITLLKQQFPNNIRQFNVYESDKVVAGVTVFETENVAHVQYISADENKQELGSLDLVFNELISTIFRDKTYFDFGISNENQGQNINEGLLNWKEDFGARTVVQQLFNVKTRNYVKLNDIMI